MTAAITYARVSSEEQAAHGYSLPSQVAACRKRASDLGASQIIECIDEGVSGEVLNRPGLEKARQLVKAGGVSLFICYDPDRFSRKLSHQLLVTEELERAGVKLEFVNFDWQNTPEGRLFYALRGAISEFEKEKIKERTMRGRMQAAKQGRISNNIRMYGYKYGGGQVEIDPKEAALVQQIFTMYLEGKGCRIIADLLNEMGIASPKGKTWRNGVVAGLLKNEAYIGNFYLNKWNSEGLRTSKYLPEKERKRLSRRPKEEWIMVKTPRIIDDAAFLQAQSIMSNARRLFAGNNSYLLGGLLTCGVCGSSVPGVTIRHKGQKTYRYYVCHKHCFGYTQNAPRIEGEVLPVVQGWLANPKAWAKAIQPPKEVSPDNGQALQKELEDVGVQQRRLLGVIQKGLVDLSAVEGEMAKLRSREIKLKKALAGADKPQPRPVNVANLKALSRELLEGLQYGEDAQRKQILRKIIERIIVYRDTIEIIGRNPL